MATVQETIEKATKWMEDIAKDNSHGYDQIHRLGPDYDCSSLNIKGWTLAGVDLKGSGATYTGNLVPALLKNGFEEITDKVDFKTGKGLKRGDILFAKGHHVAQYCGNGKEVEASINEKGKATGGKTGDQTGREILIRNYRNYPWTNAYRYVGDGKDEKAVVKTKTADTKPIESTVIYKVTAKSGLNIRKAPGAAIITAVPFGTKLEKDNAKDKNPNDSWIPVKYKNIHGWCSKKWLERV